MTPWEWSLAVLTIAPIVSGIAAVFLYKQQATRGSAAFLALAGIGGVSACVYGVVADAPFTLQTSVLFSMVAAFDKFSAILFLPFAFTIFVAGLEQLNDHREHESAQRGIVRSLAVALLVMSVSWIVMVTNIMALAMSLMAMLFSIVVLAALDHQSRSTVSRWFFVHIAGVLAIIAGWFVLSSGALFNDFSTISYIAAQLDTARLATSFAFVLLGISLLASSLICTKGKESLVGLLSAPGIRSLVRVALIVVPIYVLLRLLLFVLPPLTVWYALPVGVIGVMALGCATKRLQHGTLQSTASTHLAGSLLLALGSTVFFQATGMFDAMNTVLFGALLMTIGGSLAIAAGEWSLNGGRYGSVFEMIQRVSALGLPPSILFMGQWMVLSTLFATVISIGHRPLAAAFAFAFLFWIKGLWRRGATAGREVRSLTLKNDGTFVWPPLLLLGVSTIGAFFVPWALARIGAAPLTLAPNTWNAALVSGNDALRLCVIVGIFLGCTAILWVFRDRAVQDAISPSEEMVHNAPEETRLFAFRRDVARLSRQYLLTPVAMRMAAARHWYDERAQRVVSPTMLFVVLVILLSLAFSV